MRYTDYVSTNQGFQTSVNLELDLNDKDKINGYIPTEQSVKSLGTFLRSFYYEKDTQNRASVLIGPYGRGKSHLLLVLTALTSMDVFGANDYSVAQEKKMQRELCQKISAVDHEVGELAKTIVESGIRTLPIIINSNTRDISQAFMVALNNSLMTAGLENLLPTTYFDSALDVIEKWENEIPDAFSKLTSELKSQKKTVEELKISLKRFDNEGYDLFCSVYPNVAAGMKFNPMTSMDVVKLYISVVDALVEQTKYTGINIVFDEFSKFLESNLEKSQMYNLKIIQDLAEAASRSGRKQIHFTCITHKDILEYSTSDSFKTVEGRFSKIYFVASSEQNYELISNAIVKKNGYEKFIKDNKKEFEKIISIAAMANVFRELKGEAFEQKVVYGCFPLAPLTVYSLLKVSELVGQNERTLFTFLANHGKNTLSEFIEKERGCLELVTTDAIYDYFEELFKKEVFNAPVHSCWAKADSAIRQLTDVNQIKIVKAIALINMIKDGLVKPVPTFIKAALLLDDNTFDVASQELQRKHILSQRDSSEFVMLTANGVDVQKNITNQIESKAIKVSVCQELNQRWDWGYIIPHEHNDKNCILRCFKRVFIDAEVFCRYKNAQQILDEFPYDGVLIYIVDCDGMYRDAVVEKITSFKKYPQIVLALSKEPFGGGDILKKLVAAEQLKEQAIKNKDEHYLEEIEYFEEDLQKQVVSLVDRLYSPSSKNSKYINTNGPLSVGRQALLNQRISSICDDVYRKTPIINNEMVNKRVLNAQNLKGRDIVVSWLLNHSDDSIIPCMDGFGPEVSIFKSVFKSTGLDSQRTANSEGINEVLAVIKKFIADSENEKQCFSTLYDKLLSKPYGMRRGVIPLFVAYAMRPFKENVVLYHSGKEVELSASILSGLNDMPSKYELLLESGTQEKETYLDEIEGIFGDYIDNKIGSANRIYSVMRCIQNWYRALPEYTKKYTVYLEDGEKKNIEKYIPELRSDLSKFEINSRDILLVQWRKRLSEDGNLSECVEKISLMRHLLDSHIENYRAALCKVLVAYFAPGYQGSLPQAIKNWYKELPVQTKKHVFDANSNALLSIANNNTSFNENDVLDVLVNAFEAISIEDWTDATADSFINDIHSAIKTINEFKGTEAKKSSECKVAISMPGISVEKSFSADDISPLAKTAMNNMEAIFEEYNDALAPDEKLAILTQLIGRIIQ